MWQQGCSANCKFWFALLSCMDKKDKEKKQVLLRLSPRLWEELADWAEDDFRSINGQIEFLLNECVNQRKKINKKIE